MNPDIIRLDSEGYALALKVGVARIKAICEKDKSIESDYFEISVVEDEISATNVDMQGYNIEIMSYSSEANIDPHSDDYKLSNKEAKIKAWDEAEDKYHCNVVVINYPDDAKYGNERINKIKEWALSGSPKADIYVISSSWLRELVEADATLDVSEYYAKYGKGQMNDAYKDAGSVEGKLYVAPAGMEAVNYIDHGLIYNYNKVLELGLDDPAELFNKGKWTYSEFVKWVTLLQSKLNEGEYAIGGNSYYYWLGMSQAANVKLTDINNMEICLDSSESKEALNLLHNLVEKKIMNPNATYPGADNSFNNQKTIMISGRYWNLSVDSLWPDGMWGDETNIAFVPYPYPDNLAKEDTRVAILGATLQMFANKREYGSTFDSEDVYRVINDIYLNTNLYTNYDNDLSNLKESIADVVKNEASVEAIMYYNYRRIIFDVTDTIYSSNNSILVNATKQVVYEGKDYQSVFDNIKNDYLERINELF